METDDRHRLLYAAVESAHSSDDLVHSLYRIGEEFGFRATTLMVMPAKTDLSLANLILESQLPIEFFEQIDEMGPVNKCPLFDKVRSSIMPVTWSLETLARQQEVINGFVGPGLSLFREHHLLTSTLLPLASIDGARHIVRFDGDKDPLPKSAMNDLLALTMQFFEAYDSARYPLTNNPCGLTDRELEILHWTATGKTTSEIARIMTLSDHTINAYMNNAFKKLDCVNRTQLVAKALRMRVIR